MGLTNARDIQYHRLDQIKHIRSEIKQIHESVIKTERPKSLDTYIKLMKEKKVTVIPSINKQQKLQGFRFEYKGLNLKGSEVHRSMSGGKIIFQMSSNINRGIPKQNIPTVKLTGKAVELSNNIATALAKRIVKKTIKKVIDLGMGI